MVNSMDMNPGPAIWFMDWNGNSSLWYLQRLFSELSYILPMYNLSLFGARVAGKSGCFYDKITIFLCLFCSLTPYELEYILWNWSLFNLCSYSGSKCFSSKPKLRLCIRYWQGCHYIKLITCMYKSEEDSSGIEEADSLQESNLFIHSTAT